MLRLWLENNPSYESGSQIREDHHFLTQALAYDLIDWDRKHEVEKGAMATGKGTDWRRIFRRLFDSTARVR